MTEEAAWPSGLWPGYRALIDSLRLWAERAGTTQVVDVCERARAGDPDALICVGMLIATWHRQREENGA